MMTTRITRLTSRLIAVDSPELAPLGHRLPNRVSKDRMLKSLASPTPPAGIALALFALEPDAFDIVEMLGRADYPGRVLALAPSLPNRRIVMRELKSRAPKLRVRIVTLPEMAGVGPPVSQPDRPKTRR